MTTTPSTFPFGSLKVTLTSGTAWEIVSRDGNPVGFYFSGSGKAAATKENPLPAPLTALSATFSEGVFFYSPAVRPELPPLSGEPVDTVPHAKFQKLLSRFKMTGWDAAPAVHPGIELALASWNEEQNFRSLLLELQEGSPKPGGQFLSLQQRIQSRPYANAYALLSSSGGAVQSARWGERAGSPRALGLTADFRELPGLEGVFETKYRVTLPPSQGGVVFHLAPLPAADGRNQAMPVYIDSVTWGEDQLLSHVLEGNEYLAVRLPKERQPAPEVEIGIRYSRALPRKWTSGGFGALEGVKLLGEESLPLLSGSAAGPASAKLRSCWQGSTTLISNGLITRTWQQGKLSCIEAERPAGKAGALLVLGGVFNSKEEMKDEVTCRLFTLGKPDKNEVKLPTLFHWIRGLLDVYFGPFPFQTFSIAEGLDNIRGGGQGPPPQLLGADVDGRLGFESGAAAEPAQREEWRVATYVPPSLNLLPAIPLSNQQFAYSLSQLYWGQSVRGETPQDAAFVDGLALLGSAIVMEGLKGKEGWSTVVEAAKAKEKHSGDPAARVLVALDMIRTQAGSEVLFSAVKTLYMRNKQRGVVTRDDFRGILEQMSKKDWSGFFQQRMSPSPGPKG